MLGRSPAACTRPRREYSGATEAAVFGPFFVEGRRRCRSAATSPTAVGESRWVERTVTDTDGRPVAGARIDVWELVVDFHRQDAAIPTRVATALATARGHVRALTSCWPRTPSLAGDRRAMSLLDPETTLLSYV